MKLKLSKFFSSVVGTSLFFATTAHASMLAVCNDTPNYTQYICCPSSGGWIVSDACNAGASTTCVNDSGLIAGTQTTILQDCKNRGGGSVQYYVNSAQEMSQSFDANTNSPQNNRDN